MSKCVSVRVLECVRECSHVCLSVRAFSVCVQGLGFAHVKAKLSVCK